ncbi:MAG TPA: hypothetical protein VLT91_00245 [Rhizomicrobium sp.]|nr:hypothetical protein [Rhizomicrobium sp.]
MSILPTVLPRLRGVWLAAYRAIWIAAAAVTLVSAAGATWVELTAGSTSWQSLVHREYGLGLRVFANATANPWYIASIFGPEAKAAGIHAGDVVVSINRVAISGSTPSATVAQALSSKEGERTDFRLRASNGAIYQRTLIYHERNVELWYRGSGLNPFRQYLLRRIGYDLMTLLLLGVAAILFLRRSHDIVAAAFSLTFCLIPIGPAIEFWSEIGVRSAYEILSSLPYIFLLMVGCAFPDGRYWPSWTRFSLVVVPLVLAPLMFFAAEYSQFSLFSAPGFLAVIVILALRYRQLGAGAERQQFRWVAFSLAAGVITLIMRVPFAFLQGDLRPAPMSSWIDLAGSFLHATGYMISGGGFGVSLLKYRLYDAESFIGRSAALTATTLILAGVWAAFEKALETFLPDIIGSGQTISGIVSAGLAVVLVTPLHGRIHAWIEKRFQNGVYRLREKLPELLDVLSERVSTGQLCEQILVRVSRDLRVVRAALVLQDGDVSSVPARHAVEERHVQAWLETNAPSEPLLTDDGEALFVFCLPLIDPIQESSIGWLLLGPRPDGTPPNRDERDALEKVAGSIAHAILTAEARAARESRLATILDALETRLSAAETHLAAGPERFANPAAG